MKATILIVSVLGTLALGFFLMVHLDRILNENRKSMESKAQKKAPSCTMLPGSLPDEELAREIRAFRDTHDGMKVVLYDNPPEAPDAPHAGRKK